MSEIWNFSDSLRDQVRHCIAAATIHEDNKWSKAFGHVITSDNVTQKFTIKTVIDLCDSPDIEPIKLQDESQAPSKQIEEQKTSAPEDLDTMKLEEFIESIEADIQSNIGVIITECQKNHTLLPILADRLSPHTIEKVSSGIFDRKDLESNFLNKFFELFLPVYIKREYNSNTLDIIVRCSKKYPVAFKILLKMIIKDVDIPNKVLQDYIITLNGNDRSKFIIDVTELDLNGVEFVNHLFAIYTAYKDCMKTGITQNYVESLLFQYSTFCVTDRNYGRLFLAYLQAQKDVKSSASYEKLQKLLEEHKSPFKRPCETLIRELLCPDDGNESSSDGSE